MTNPIRRLAFALLYPFLFGCATSPRTHDWATVSELTQYQQTATYDQVVSYCEQLQKASPWIHVITIGKTPMGRAMPLVIVSKDRDFDAQRIHSRDKAVVFINNGIHSGEIEGKEACLALLRDIAINKSRAALLDHVNLLVLPIFNIDGHERSSPYNRINQDGPQNMGWRCTAQNLNLNRDFMKADALETMDWLTTFHTWKPDMVIDTHTTDGADFQYDVTFDVPSGDETAPSVAQWCSQKLEPYLLESLKADGHQPNIFFEFADRRDPSKGIVDGGLQPRYCTGYTAINNRPGILIETHSLKPFETRIKATYALLVRTLELINANPGELLTAVREADQRTMKLATAPPPQNQVVVTTSQPANDAGEPFTFKGYECRLARSEASGSDYQVWDRSRPIDIPSKIFHSDKAVASVPMPAAFLVPPQWIDVIDRLRLHGLPLTYLKQPLSIEVDSVRFKNVKWNERPFESRHEVSYEIDPIHERRTYPAGTAVVLTNSPTAIVAVNLLNPAAPDCLVHWGFFDVIFEQKEYYEEYIMAPMADRMLNEQPGLRAEFDKWLQENPDKKTNSRARLDFFYKRSPYWDNMKDVYPVGWVIGELPIQLSSETPRSLQHQ